MHNLSDMSSAISDFNHARNRAILQEIISRFRGESIELLSYEEVRQKLRLQGSSDQGLQDIPLDSIVGSVGRYHDFTRSFLPREDVNKDRWARVKIATNDIGTPPIDVYKIGDVYFVIDGNHRVSVARQMGASHIQAYVTDVRTRVKLTPEIQPDDLIVKAEYAYFLERTRIDELRNDVDLSISVPGKYPILEEHIAVHRYYMGIEQKREIPYAEAVAHWYDYVYLSTVRLIRERGILRYFPNRTETDLYIWIATHRAELEEDLGWEIKTERALVEWVEELGTQESAPILKLGEKLLNIITLGKLESGPQPGSWRKEILPIHQGNRLFFDVIIPISGKPESWSALEQAIIVAQREDANLHGLHVLDPISDVNNSQAEKIREKFEHRCEKAGLTGELSIAKGDIARQICEHSRFGDLVISHLAFPPAPEPLAKLDSGFHQIIQRCPRPILAVPGVVTALNNALLAYNGSPKSTEALYIATYCAGKWSTKLTVTTNFKDDQIPPETLLEAKTYLEENGVEANFVPLTGQVVEGVLGLVEKENIDLLILGGYGRTPALELILGSVVDELLRVVNIPTLICR